MRREVVYFRSASLARDLKDDTEPGVPLSYTHALQ